ncbi:TrbC/VirB2 family protein [Tepidimonas charontis]|uniref:TrbC/VIRB2 family protein n=1 Tax=Tepidimonas charontis TaxID=2267262 RepID=A0A554X514_9BURK|nr:TrbC/VirB2 family protein [Tepidimonas charontis]TSE30915.1 TrbC/VIRB2 family protein [Tepidimonas charontis]
MKTTLLTNIRQHFTASRLRHRAAIVGAAALAAPAAFAGTTELPWDSAITTLKDNLTGPVATAISVVAFLAAGAALVFGGDELGNIAKRLLYVVLGVAIIVLGNNFLTTLGLTNSGALI